MDLDSGLWILAEKVRSARCKVTARPDACGRQMTSLADIERSYVSAGRALYPLQSVDDAAALLRAAAAVPAHAPSRSRHIVDKLQAVGSALAGRASQMLLNIGSVLAEMQSRPSVERLVNELPPTNGIVLHTQLD